MRPTFLGFETTRKSLMAAQKALDITGHNMANVNTTGYTRQRVDLLSVVSAPGGDRVQRNNILSAGQGVHMNGVDQIRDPYLDKKFRESNSEAMECGTKTSLYKDVENVLDNIETDGIDKYLGKLKKALQSFATDSTDRVEIANIFVQNSKQLVNLVNNYDSKLTDLQEDVKFEIDTSVNELNATLAKIADINKAIVDDYQISGNTSLSIAGDYIVNATYGPNELLDARNVLLDSLSSYGNIETISENDGSVTVKLGGAVVVEGDVTTTLRSVEDTVSGAVSLVFDTGEQFKPSSGSMKGYLDVYNGNGRYAKGEQTGVEGLAYYKSVINEFANVLAEQFNTANVDTAAPTVNKDIFVTCDGTSVITAQNIRVSDQLIDDPLYIIPTTQDGKLDNAHVMKLMGVFDGDFSFGGDIEDFKGTFDEYISSYTSKLAQEIQFQNGRYEANESLVTTVLSDRDSTSGVNMDEEGINMMNFQKWFSASARVMTAMDEVLETIINSMGLVGR